MKPETINILEGNIEEKIDISIGNYFLHMTQKKQRIWAKINQWGYMQLNFFYVAIDTINKIKMQPIECEKMFENQIIN